LIAAGAISCTSLFVPGLALGKERAAATGKRLIAQLPRAAVTRFRDSLAGMSLTQTSTTYDSARQLWNAAYDGRPGLIAQCANAIDVAKSVNFARENRLLFAVRSGGHSLAGKSTCNGGLVIDLTPMRSISVDPDGATAQAGAGVLLAELDAATARHSLAVTCGTEPSTGIAGLTLGGGLGWLMGKFGLCCDSLRSVEMVLANGQIVQVTHESDPDLFWALRGAGANFGIATKFEYQLHPVPDYFGGVIQYPIDSLGPALRHYRTFVRSIPDEVGIAIGIGPGAGGKPTVSMAAGYCGSAAAGEPVLAPLRAFGPKLQDDITAGRYFDFQERGGLPPGLRLSGVTRSAFLEELSDDAVDVMAHWGAIAPPFAGSFVVEFFHGKAARTAPDATAFPHRQVRHNFSIHSDWANPGDAEISRRWGEGFWAAMQPFVSKAVYSNYLGDEGPDRAAAAYGGNLARLRRLKARYDPQNLFQLNQNIVPAGDRKKG
jgi:hypothetical protein